MALIWNYQLIIMILSHINTPYHNILNRWPVGFPYYMANQPDTLQEKKGFLAGERFDNPIETKRLPISKCSMYGIFTYIWVIYGVHVGKYSIHEAYGI